MKVNQPDNLKHIIKYENDNDLKNKYPALFLDRDGVLIKDCHYIKDPRDVSLLDGSIQLIKYAKKQGWKVVIITNQSGISRGFFTWKDYEKITWKMLDLFGQDIQLDGIYANGFSENTKDAEWRKPSEGMLLRASKDLNIDLDKSILCGDRLSDLIAGQKAGLNALIHVLTGHGIKERIDVLKMFEKFQESSSKKTSKSCNIKYYLKPELVLISHLKEFPFDKIFKVKQNDLISENRKIL